MMIKLFTYKNILLVAVVALATYFAVRISFGYSLYGDDWIVLWSMRYNSGPGTPLDYTSLLGYFGPYTIPHYTTALIYHFWGENSSAYFIIAYLCRVLAALGLSYLIVTITKSYKVALITGLLYSVTAVGLETTNWGPFNMPTYIAIFLFAISLSLLFRFNKSSRPWQFVFSLMLLILSIMMFPQRMHGAVFLYVGVEVMLFTIKPSLNLLPGLIARIAIVLLTFVLLVNLNTFGGTGDRQWISNQVSEDLSVAKPYFWATLATTIGNLYVPDLFWDFPQVNTFIESLIGGSTLSPRFRPIFIIFGVITIFFTSLTKKRKWRFLLVGGVLGFLWTLFVKSILSDPDNLFHTIPAIFGTLLGGYIYSYLISYLFTLKRKDKLLVPLAMVCVWPIVMILASWLRSSFQPLHSTFRYTTVAGAAMPLLAGLLATRAKNFGNKLLAFSMIAALLLIHFSVSQQYLGQLLKYRNAQVYDRLWSQFKELTADYMPDEEFAVFYFEGDPGLIYNVFAFGFPPRLALIYDIPPDRAGELPVFVDIFENLKNVVTGGDHIKAFAKDPQVILPHRIYAFNVTNDKLSTIKPEVIKRLKSEIKDYK